MLEIAKAAKILGLARENPADADILISWLAGDRTVIINARITGGRVVVRPNRPLVTRNVFDGCELLEGDE